MTAPKADPIQLYLGLMKRTLAYALWEEPPVPVEYFESDRPWLKRRLLKGISSLLKRRYPHLQLVEHHHPTAQDRAEGRIWPGQAHTMIGLKRLDHLQNCIERVLRDNVPGDFIETGVWRGGACIFMRAMLAAYQVTDRRVFVADSFEGLPKPDAKAYPQDAGDTHHCLSFLAVSQTEVAENFRKYGLLDDQVCFVKGWFKDALPNAPISRLAVLRLDGDMYQSTIEVLNALYPKLSAGGFCIIDDFALKGCQQAVLDYRREHQIQCPITAIDDASAFWRKESPTSGGA